jgi:predicted secreted protein
VKVTPTDSWGNPSLKVFQGGGFSTSTPTGADSLQLLDTRLVKGFYSKNLLEEIFVEFGSNQGGAQVPSGAQAVMASGSTFTAVAPQGDGTGLTISVRTINVSGDTTGALKHLQAKGSVTVSWSASGVVIGPGGAPAAPKNLVVQDYQGANGAGDQGFYVMVNFPHSTDHNRVHSYRIWRELDVTTGLDANGNVVVVSPAVKKWVSWTSIDAVPSTATTGEDIARAVVPVTDNVATRWAVTAEAGNLASNPVASGKRVFTQESVQQMAQFFGVDPNRVVNPEVLGDMFVPSADYVKSIIGDQKNVVFGALDPDIAALAAGTVPNSIRTSGATVTTSAQTVAEGAVAAVDNIPPVAVTGAKANGSAISWTKSVDDRTVGYVNYRGFAIPIAGVAKYEIMGGSSAENLALIATVPAGAAGFEGSNLPAFLRVDALDLDNRTVGSVFSGSNLLWKTLGDGSTLYLQVVGSTPNTVDFEDFIAFAQAFNAVTGGSNFNINSDTNKDGIVNFPDFIAFAGSFGKSAAGPSTKPVIGAPGVNENAEFSLRLGSDRVMVGETVSVDVSLANVQALMGYQFAVNYETDKFEFVGAAPADQDLLASTGGETPLFHTWADKAGEVTVANAVINGSSVNGGGDIVRLTFKVLREFEDNARFEIANGLIADPNQLSNSAVVAGLLEIQSTPTEFALLQNFPNPFNPETTIQYNLSESADVTLHIYNVFGQVVRTLVSERQAAGRYRVQWSGMDDRSVPVSSGIYFYEIRAGKNKDVRKLMLLK